MEYEWPEDVKLKNRNRSVSLEDLKNFTFDVCDYSDYYEIDEETTSWNHRKGYQKFDEIIGMVQKSLDNDYPATVPKKLTVKKEYIRRDSKDEEASYHMSLTQMEAVDLKDLTRGFHPGSTKFTFKIDFVRKIYLITSISDFRDWKLTIEVKPAESIPEELYGYNMDSNVTRWIRRNFGEFAEWGKIHKIPRPPAKPIEISDDELPFGR